MYAMFHPHTRRRSLLSLCIRDARTRCDPAGGDGSRESVEPRVTPGKTFRLRRQYPQTRLIQSPYDLQCTASSIRRNV